MFNYNAAKINIVKRSVYNWCTTGTKSLNFPYAIINAVVQEEKLNIAYELYLKWHPLPYKNKVEGEVMDSRNTCCM